MSNYVPLSPSVHAGKHWLRPENLAFCETWQTVPLVLGEIEHLIPIAPIAFVRKQMPDRKSGFELVALLSPLPQRNLYLRPNKTWVAGYVPAWIRMHPFRPLRSEGSLHEYVMCIEEGVITEDRQKPGLFTAEGATTEALQKTLKFMEEFIRERTVTQHAVDRLQAHGLIEPWTIPLRKADGTVHTAVGLFHINGKQLNNLEPEALAELNRCGALHIAYAQLLSKQRSGHFGRLIQAQDQARQSHQSGTVDVEKFFGKPDDTLKFDF